MTTAEIQKILTGYANTDMRRARKERKKSEYGSLLITQTQKGLVDLAYDPATKQYALVSQDGGQYQFRGTAGQTVAELRDNIYTVTEVQ